MSDLYANITETTQPDSDQAGRHTEIIADLHTGDPAVMAAALRGAADRLDPGDPVEAEEWAARQADERAARDAALVAPWREAFRALSGVIPDRHASRAEPAGPRPGGDFLDHFEASIGAQRNQLRALVTDMARQLADAGYVPAGDATLPGALRDALGDLAESRTAFDRLTAAHEAYRETVEQPRHTCNEKRGALIIGKGDIDRCGCPVDRPMYAHDADCNTIHDGPEPCPPPQCGDRPAEPAVRHCGNENYVHETHEWLGMSADGDKAVKGRCPGTGPVAESVPVDVLDLVRQYGTENYECGVASGLRDDDGSDHYDDKARALFVRIEAEVQRLRDERDEARADFDRLAASHGAYVKAVADAQQPDPPPGDVVTVTMTKSAAEYAYSALFKRMNELGYGNIHRAGFAAAMKDVANALRTGDGKPVRPKAGLTDPPTERPHIIQLSRKETDALCAWLNSAVRSGSISVGRRLTADAVEGGGLLVRARPFRFDDRAAEDAEQPDAQEAARRVVEAARAWVDARRPWVEAAQNLQRRELAAAVDALGDHATLRPDILHATRQAGWRDGVRWAAAEADALVKREGRSWYEWPSITDITDHLRSCAADPDRSTLISRDQAPEARHGE